MGVKCVELMKYELMTRFIDKIFVLYCVNVKLQSEGRLKTINELSSVGQMSGIKDQKKGELALNELFVGFVWNGLVKG